MRVVILQAEFLSVQSNLVPCFAIHDALPGRALLCYSLTNHPLLLCRKEDSESMGSVQQSFLAIAWY